jgi:hypothetical protein
MSVHIFHIRSLLLLFVIERLKSAVAISHPLDFFVYARHGRELMGCPAFAKGYGKARSPLYEDLLCSC